MKNIVQYITIFLVLFVSQVDAQERYIYTQYTLNPELINAGATGFDNEHQILFNYRNNWSSFEGSPRTATFSYNGPVADRLGLGALLLRDRFASFETIKGLISSSYHIEAESYKIGIGLTAEYLQYKLVGDDLNSNLVNLDDPQLLQRLEGAQFFDASVGLYGEYGATRNVNFGISLPGLVRSRLDEATGQDASERELNYILHAGYVYAVEGYDFTVEPSIYIKKLRRVPTHTDLNLLMNFMDEKFTGGISYTLGADNRLGFLIGTQMKTLRFIYSYNLTTHEFQQYNNGAHEIGVSVNLENLSSQNTSN